MNPRGISLIILALAFGGCKSHAAGGDDVPADDAAIDSAAGDGADVPLGVSPACAASVDQDTPWARCAWGPYGEVASGVAFGPSGDLAVVGDVQMGTQFDGVHAVAPNAEEDGFLARWSARGILSDLHAYGGPFVMGDEDHAQCVGVDAQGNALIAGTYGGTMDMGDGFVLPGDQNSGHEDRRELYVAKVGADGHVMWARRGVSRDFDEALDLVMAPDGGFVLVGTLGGGTLGPVMTDAGGGFITRYDSDGSQRWAIAGPPGYSLETSGPVALAPDGSVAWVVYARPGTQIGTLTLQAGFALVNLGPDGTPRWMRQVLGQVAGVGYRDDGVLEVVTRGGPGALIDLGGGNYFSNDAGQTVAILQLDPATGETRSAAGTDLFIDPRITLPAEAIGMRNIRVRGDGDVVAAMVAYGPFSFAGQSYDVYDSKTILARFGSDGSLRAMRGPFDHVVVKTVALGPGDRVALAGGYTDGTSVEGQALDMGVPHPAGTPSLPDAFVLDTTLAP